MNILIYLLNIGILSCFSNIKKMDITLFTAGPTQLRYAVSLKQK